MSNINKSHTLKMTFLGVLMFSPMNKHYFKLLKHLLLENIDASKTFFGNVLTSVLIVTFVSYFSNVYYCTKFRLQ